MKGGDGPYSYAHNSVYQRQGLETAKVLINEAIAEVLDIKQVISSSSSWKSFAVADLGCSVGPNTLMAVENIIDSVKLKHQSFGQNQEALEFMVFFNDHASNDFNTLFQSLPPDKQYFAAGVPGLFQDRLFPKASLHFVHCSYSLHWLSKAPKELIDKSSPAWNKGRIYYIHAPKEVREAYSDQFAKDMESFLNARAKELVSGGLMALILTCLPDGNSIQYYDFAFMDLLEASLKDMVYAGLVSEDKLDSFNFPQYNPTPEELGTLIEINSCFSIERMEPLVCPAKRGSSGIHGVRAVWEELVAGYFGSDIVDELFDRFEEKVAKSSIFLQSGNKQMIELYVLLKRKTY